MSHKLPVFFSRNDLRQVGYSEVLDDKLVLTLDKNQVASELGALMGEGLILAFFLDVEYKPAISKED